MTAACSNWRHTGLVCWAAMALVIVSAIFIGACGSDDDDTTSGDANTAPSSAATSPDSQGPTAS